MNIDQVNRGIVKHKSASVWVAVQALVMERPAVEVIRGARSRSGWRQKGGFEGGQMPVIRRVPKRGFNNSRFALKIAEINLQVLERCFADGAEVTPAALEQRGLLKTAYDEVKILGDGELTKKLSVAAHRFSRSAKEKIEKAGGQAVVLPGRTPVEDKKLNADAGQS